MSPTPLTPHTGFFTLLHEGQKSVSEAKSPHLGLHRARPQGPHTVRNQGQHQPCAKAEPPLGSHLPDAGSEPWASCNTETACMTISACKLCNTIHSFIHSFIHSTKIYPTSALHCAPYQAPGHGRAESDLTPSCDHLPYHRRKKSPTITISRAFGVV